MNKLTRFLLLLIGLVLMAACGPIIGHYGDPISPKTKLSPGQPQLRGTNLTGGEVDWPAANTDSPTSGQDYLFVSHQDIDYLALKGVRFVRLNMSWECTQPVLNGPLASTGNGGVYVSTLVDRVNYLTSKDIHVLIEPHGASDKNFVRYKGNLVGSAAVPNSAFADFWARMATQFKGNPKVMYGLSNEPHDMSTMQWYAGAQAAINAIRAAGATTPIFVPGNGWTAPQTWNSTSVDTATTKVSNATGWSTLVDPGKNLVVSVHTYFDAGGGGGADDIASPDIIQTRLQPVVDWARAKDLKVHLSELGANSKTAGSQLAVTNALKYMDANADVMLGWSWWSYGPPAWWGGYRFTLDPTSNYTVDNPKMAWLQPFFVSSVQPSPPPPTCTFAYSAWSTCSSNGTQMRTATASPAGCVGTPTLTQACTPPPLDTDGDGIPDSLDKCPTVKGAGSTDPKRNGCVARFTTSAKSTYDWGSGYCKEFYFTNNTNATITWRSLNVNVKDGKIRGKDAFWGATIPDYYASGYVKATPVAWTSPVGPGKTVAVGMCVDYGPLKSQASLSTITY